MWAFVTCTALDVRLNPHWKWKGQSNFFSSYIYLIEITLTSLGAVLSVILELQALSGSYSSKNAENKNIIFRPF